MILKLKTQWMYLATDWTEQKKKMWTERYVKEN